MLSPSYSASLRAWLHLVVGFGGPILYGVVVGREVRHLWHGGSWEDVRLLYPVIVVGFPMVVEQVAFCTFYFAVFLAKFLVHTENFLCRVVAGKPWRRQTPTKLENFEQNVNRERKPMIKPRDVYLGSAAQEHVLDMLLVTNWTQYPQIYYKYSWRLSIIESPDETSFVKMDGPFSANIQLCTGLLKAYDGPDELALVLGRCIAQVLLRHTGQLIKLVASRLLLAIVIGALIPECISTICIAVMILMANLAIELPYRRIQVLEADTLGLELATRAGYDVTVAPFLEEMREKTRSYRLPYLLSPLPDSQTRVANYRKLVQSPVGLLCKTSVN